MTLSAPWQGTADGVMLAVRARPGAPRDAVTGVLTEADGKSWLGVSLRAVAEDGKANTALIALVAKALGLPKAAVQVESGATARRKRLRLLGESRALIARLEALSTPPSKNEP